MSAREENERPKFPGTEAFATEDQLKQMWGTPIPTDDPHVKEFLMPSGVRTRWLKSLKGYWRKVSSELIAE
jgi:hypothetical protein